MDDIITEPLKIAGMAQSMGVGGIGLLAVVYAFRLAMQTVTTLKSVLEQRRQPSGSGNGSGNGSYEKLVERLTLNCPVALGSRTIDDLYEVAVRQDGTMVAVKEGLERLAGEMKDGNSKVAEAVHELAMDLAKGGSLR